MSENNDAHLEDVKKVMRKEFGVSPDQVERMRIGSANEVYATEVNGKQYIVRLNASPNSLQGSDKYIPLFKSLGIKVPDIAAEDYTKETIPLCYQIQTRLEGVDIDKVIASLSEDQLQEIAAEIAAIAKKLKTIPTNGKFGYADVTEQKLKDSCK